MNFKSQISNLKSQIQPDNTKLFLNTLVFFLNDEQLKTVEAALEKAIKTQPTPRTGLGAKQETKAEKMAEALTTITEDYLK